MVSSFIVVPPSLALSPVVIVSPDILPPDIVSPDIIFSPDIFSPDIFSPDIFRSPIDPPQPATSIPAATPTVARRHHAVVVIVLSSRNAPVTTDTITLLEGDDRIVTTV
jgi:hypothetical protein